ncbi:MAG: DUF4149 domain-containing protein [Ahrensia sp.]
MTIVALLLTATLFGGMVFFTFGFTSVLFTQLTTEEVRPIMRGTFPYYYLVVIGLSAAAALAALVVSPAASGGLAAITVSALYERQILMPQINAATYADDQLRFKRMNDLSLVIQFVQIAIAALALIRIA